MKFVFASDSFKGSLSSADTIRILTKAAREVIGDCRTVGVEVADGGEGTVSAVTKAARGRRVEAEVHDPIMRKIRSSYGVFGDNAIIEMAEASGLTLLNEQERNPLITTTYGTGELILDALERGIRNITIAIGGSATNDGGTGCLSALGVKFLDSDGNVLEGNGGNLAKISAIDISGLDKRIEKSNITVMCDVTNPLCGEKGATYVFGPQKGASAAMLETLEGGMQNYRKAVLELFGIDCNDIEGSGAAGGLGAAMSVFLGGRISSGIETVLDIIHFDDIISDADWIITGEGRTDHQSCYGKVIYGVGKHALKYGIPVVAVCGSLGEGYEKLYEYGITSFITTVDKPMTLDEAMSDAEKLYYSASVRAFRFIKSVSRIS